MIKRLLPYLVIFSAIFIYLYSGTVMPGVSYQGAILGENPAQMKRLKTHIETIAATERNMITYIPLDNTQVYITNILKNQGFNPRLQGYMTGGQTAFNIEVIIPGQISDTVVIGAHYDSVNGAPGANDNASGVAALLELAPLFKNPYYTMRLVFFVNEEPPYFKTEKMGSYVYAKSLSQQKVKVVAAYALDMLGAYYETANSQKYPFPMNFFYPSTANFIGFVGNASSKSLVHHSIKAFRDSGVKIGSEGASVPSVIRGVDYSDHWSFYQFGVPALMITDTSYNRYKDYHQTSDTIDKINFKGYSVVVQGLGAMFTKLYVNAPTQ